MAILIDSESPKLFSILASIPGKKTLVIDKTLSILISSLASFSQLKDHGIESVKWLQQPTTLDSEIQTRVLIISRPDSTSIRQVASLVKSTHGKEFALVLVPRRTIQVDEILEKEGVLADVDIKLLQIQFTQEDTDFIRVDVPPAVHSASFVPATETFSISKSLIAIQKEFGKFGRIQGKGSNVESLVSLLTQMQADLLIEEKIELETEGLLGDCLILDRTTDLLTPLLTQLTYEGLLYELYPISGSVLELPSSIQFSERKITLGPGDPIFSDLRAENFSNVGPKLSGTASTLSSELDSRHSLKTTTQLKAFVSRIPNLQSSQKLLKVHIELTELLLARTKSPEFRQVLELEQSIYGSFSEPEFAIPLESIIAQQFPIAQVLRILCLWSTVHNGLKRKDYDFFSARVLQAYGFHYSLTLHALQKSGLFIVRTPATEKGRGGWLGFSRTWKLCVEDVDERNPDDLAYLYSGYAPLNLRILQAFIDPTFFEDQNNASKRIADGMLRQLRGPMVDDRSSVSRKEKVLVVVFLGGCTATELAGVRYLANKLGREVLIISRGIVSGVEFMDGFINLSK